MNPKIKENLWIIAILLMVVWFCFAFIIPTFRSEKFWKNAEQCAMDKDDFRSCFDCCISIKHSDDRRCISKCGEYEVKRWGQEK